MAITKERKGEVLTQYDEWLNKCQAVILVEYSGISMKEFDAIRAKVRESGGEFHVVKNTLAKKAFEAHGMHIKTGMFEKSTAATFAFSDVAATAKALTDATKGIEPIKLKGGFVEKQALDASQVKNLVNLPTLPVARAQLLGVIQAPASQLVRLLAEPGRRVAAVIKANSEKAAPAAA
jgi:large subunit ribosomal protein L10